MTQTGPFAWHELRVPDLGEGARFYGALLGWTFETNAMGSAIKSGDATIGGASEVKPGLLSHWTPYLRSDDVVAVAAAARSAGGIVTSGAPADVPGIGRLAPILDTDKSIFAAFTPNPAIPVDGQPGPGHFVWERLRTPDPAAAAAFYAATFGWKASLAPDGGGVFELPDGTRFAELVKVSPDAPTGWLPFVLVESLTAARAQAVELGATAGGEIILPDKGKYALVTDSQDVPFALHQAL